MNDKDTVVVLLEERIANYSALRDERVETGRDENGYALATEALERVLADLLAAAPSTSVDVEAAAKRMFEAEYPDVIWEEWIEYCLRHPSIPSDIPLWRSRALAALKPSTDKGGVE